VLLALLFFTQEVELDALGHPDPERRIRAGAELRRAASFPLLLRGLRHADPEVRGRSTDVLRFLSPLAWMSRRDDPEALRHLRLAPPTPRNAAALSNNFLKEQTYREDVSVESVRTSASSYGQTLLCIGGLRAKPLDKVRAVDVQFAISEGVIWAGYAGDLEAPPSLAAWLLGRLGDPEALWIFAQALPAERIDGLLEDPRPEAFDLLLRVFLLRRPAGPLDSRFITRLAERLPTIGALHANEAARVLQDHAAELAPLLKKGADSPNRWWRFYCATLGSDPAAINRLLRDAESEIRCRAIQAALQRVNSGEWDCAALLKAVERSQSNFEALRLTRLPRLQAAAVDSLPYTPRASLAVLEDCDDPAILDAALLALRGQKDPLRTSTALLRRLTETSDDPWPRQQLKWMLDGGTDEGERAGYALGGLPAGEILGDLEERLADRHLTTRQNTLYALRRLGSRVDAGSCLENTLRDLLRRRAEVETDPGFRAELEELADAPAFVAYAPHRMLRFKAVFGCGGGRQIHPQGGWKPRPWPAICSPDWN
jgi:hypothetical protein